MSGVRTLHACLQAAIIAFPAPAQRGPVYGSAHRLKPVFTEGQANVCPCCNGRSWHVGRITAECAVCEEVLPIVRIAGHLPAFTGAGQ